MRSRKLIKTEQLQVEGRSYAVQYYEATTDRGAQRYSSELVLGPGDCIIMDSSSLGDLEWRVARMMPATVYSRTLARIT